MEWIELGELGKVSTGNTPSKKKIEYYNENYIELVKPSNFIEDTITSIELGEEYLSKEGKTKGRVAEAGNILVTCIGNIGNVGIASKEVCFNQQINCIKVNKEKALSKYVAYSILHIKPALNHVANKAVVPIINKSTFKKIKIPVPPMEIQKQIVEVLDEAQKLIDNRKKQIKLLDDLIESIFYDMFGDPVKNDKGWEVKKLGDNTEIITGNTPPRKDVDNYGEHIEWIKSDNINTPYMYLTQAEEYLSEKGKQVGRYVDKGSILMTCIAGSINCIGNVAIADREVAFNQQINAIIPLKYNLYFLYVLFLTTKEYIQNNSTSSMKGMISKGNLSNLGFIIPPLSLQNQFAEKVQAIEKQKELLQESLKLMEDNYNSLMQRAFKGELF